MKIKDVLFPNLTPVQHLVIFGTIKGVLSDNIMEDIDEVLRDVDLIHVKNFPISTFSGKKKNKK